MASWTGANRKYIATQLMAQPAASGITSRNTRIQLEKMAVRHTSIRIMVGQAYFGRARRRRNSSGSCSSNGTMGLSSNLLAMAALLSCHAARRTRQKPVFVTQSRGGIPASRFIQTFHSLARPGDETYRHKCLIADNHAHEGNQRRQCPALPASFYPAAGGYAPGQRAYGRGGNGGRRIATNAVPSLPQQGAVVPGSGGQHV